MKKLLKNIIFGFGGQLLILALGIVVPRFILKGYGDEANGLTNAITQLFTYLALIEAGVGQSALQALYKPVANNDREEVSSLFVSTKNMFKKLTLFYTLAVVFFAFIYPLFIKVNDVDKINVFGDPYLAVVLLILFQGFSDAALFYFVSTPRQLLLADGRNYITVNITTFARCLASVLRIIFINLGFNIVVVQTVHILVAVFEVLLYKAIIAKKYPWLNKKAKPNNNALKQRNAFLVHETSNVIFNSTDVLLLSIFCGKKGLDVASIYSVYSLVFVALSSLILKVHSSCYYILGQTYTVDKNEYVKVHDSYDNLYILFTFALMSTAYVTILPFVKLYTAGATEMSYIDKYLPLLFTLIQLLSCCRITSSTLIKVAGHAKKTIPNALAELMMNLTVSLILVNLIGIYGVLLGTIVALLYRTNDMIIYSNKKILKRSTKTAYKTVGVNFIIFALIVFVNHFINLDFINNYFMFVLVAGGVCIVLLGVYFGVNLLLNKSLLKTLKQILLHKKTQANSN